MKEIVEFKNSQLYQDTLLEIMSNFQIDVIPDEPVLFSHEQESLKDSKLEIVDLKNVLSKEHKKIISFSIEKIKTLFDKEHYEEYPIGEYPDLDDLELKLGYEDYQILEDERNTSTQELLGISESFLFNYIIEFLLLSRSKEQLISYLKESRIPYATEYAEELVSILQRSVA